MQSILLVGRLTADPQLIYTNNNIAKCTFILAVDSNHNGYKCTDFIPCVAWRQQAELIAQFVIKGQKIAVRGYIRSRSYIDNGKNISYMEFEVTDTEY